MVQIYQVGGSVRDELLGIKSKDIDYAVEAESYEVMEKYLVNEGYRIFLKSPEYFTIRAKLPDNPVVIDFTLCRKDGKYTDGRRPESVEICDLMGDLARRDFTVNAMAKDVDGSLIDPFGGAEDLRNGVLRCVGSPEDRMKEDSLRALRAIRFVVTKKMVMDPNLKKVFYSDWLPPLIRKLAVDRIRQELHRAFAYNTLKTMELIMEFPKAFRESIFKNNEVWLEPTNKKAK